MSYLKRARKGDQWALHGESTLVRPGQEIEVKVGDAWIKTTMKFSRTSNDYVSEVRGIYFFDGQPARLAWEKANR